MSQYNSRHGNQRSEGAPSAPSIKLDDIQLAEPSAALFDDIAERTAKVIASTSMRNGNKSTQLRSFYDEIVMWEQRCRNLNDENLAEQLPLIRMLNAKVAYAKGRELVDDNFFQLMRHCLGQVNNRNTLRHCKLFLEAFMGFYKVHRDKN